ncbi:MAG: biotin/lipoyl-binding protein [Muribaculaceae bacterium]|nr:biotin/lipoyl-binding protein [Muribaculaceae bacterium]
MKEYKYKINGNTYKVAIGDIDDNIAQVEVNGTPYKVELEKSAKPASVVSKPRPAAAPRTESGAKVIAQRPAAGGNGKPVAAPLPGVVLSIAVKVGDTVKASDTVAVLEAMKMENAIHAGTDGVVTSINVNAGDSVLEGTTIITIG